LCFTVSEKGMGNSVNSDLKPKLGEEIANAITHGVGALLAIFAFVFLIIEANEGSRIGLATYGVSLVLLYLASTLYHSLVFTRARNLFRKFDHMAIFLLIAGTYTPFCLTALTGWLRWTMLGVVWGFAILGIVLKSVFTGRFEWLSVSIYILTGWMVVVAIKPIYKFLSFDGFILLVAGGLAYTIGTVFYVNPRIRFHHSIWHLWVLAGSVLHFFSILSLNNS
jgi:hemolysin III